MKEKSAIAVQGLSISACRKRSKNLAGHLREAQLDAAWITNPKHIHYFSGFWHVGRPIFSPGLLLKASGESVLVVPYEVEKGAVAADEIVTFAAQRTATLVDDQATDAFQVALPRLKGVRRLGGDQLPSLYPLKDFSVVDVSDVIRSFRRSKDPDEVGLIRDCLRGAYGVYDCIRDILEPGLTEVQLYARSQASAVEAVGEPISEYGNDFQTGSMGGPPRLRPVERGDTAPMDISVGVRGYACDLCRTFVVGGSASPSQQAAYDRVIEALEYVETTVRAGMSCRAVYEEVYAMLEGYRDWNFPHHLGHGIGLMAHEAPRLNPNWDDIFQVGDVFTVEPGLYGNELRGGFRIEDNYWVTENGVERLSDYPREF